jgi:(4-(4-[2-(gamma-L-glutamylamino)ethyl]phenoxymethyl)furan-2-yl)methanamine synthase
MTWLALDIGGANLKAADGLGWTGSRPFALWREPEKLSAALADLLGSAPAAERVAVTMTGELCDAFETKADGVRRILAAVEAVAAGREISVYFVDGRLATIDAARQEPLLAAASNWHALAQFAGRFVGENAGLLIDVGSTTTDIIPLTAKRVAARGANDTERLLAGELVYTGVGRTPLCARVPSLPFRGRSCPVAAEVFATTSDAYVLLGDVAEQSDATWTADGRPLTKTYARARLARMICADQTLFDGDDALAVAGAVRKEQTELLVRSVAQVLSAMESPPAIAVLSGAGEFVARRVALEALPNCELISLSSRLGTEVSAVAPAHALAILAREASGR